MAASIHSLVADYLDISDEKAKKLLAAMLREVKKRAYTKGVRLPEFGTFRERNGELTFEPSESLARAVNRRFEGLESEDLATAPEQEEDEKESEGPSTITLGYQDSSSWSPIDSEEEPSDEGESSDESEPDTAEFQVPSAEEAADTTELQASEAGDATSASNGNDRERRERDGSTTSSPSASGQPSSPRSESEAHEGDRVGGERKARSERSEDRAQTSDPSPASRSSASRDEADDSSDDDDDLYPLVEDAPDEPSEPKPSSSRDQSINEAERQSLSDIWNSETVGEMSSSEETTHSGSTSGDEGASLDFDDDIQDDVEMDVPADEPTEPGSTPAEEHGTTDRAPEPAEEKKSSGARMFVTILVLLLLGGAAWYILGQRGMVQPPRTTLSTLNTQVQSLIEDPPFVGGSASGSTSETTASTGQTPSTDDGTDGQQADADQQGTQDPSSTASASSQEAASTGDPSPSINPDAGGFTIVVASRTNESGARSVRDTYRQRFGDQNLPVDVLPSTVDNTTRYRIGVGQFQSRSEAENVLEKFGAKLPDGAWILGL